MNRFPASAKRYSVGVSSPLSFPTPLHQQAAEAALDFFRPHLAVEAVLVTNSCARGVATPESDLDMAVLVSADLLPDERAELEQNWHRFSASEASVLALRSSGQFTGLHLDLFDGAFINEIWDDGGGPDGFELEVGNLLAYSAPLWERYDALSELRARWLPYYGDDLRVQRLGMVRAACLYDLEFVAAYVSRELYFQAFDRLYKAFREFLQALFISRRVYPLAYNKWIREQVAGRLNLPELYEKLPGVLEIKKLESAELVGKAKYLRSLIEGYVPLEV